jgi:multisubunit Na+/H+ antiporter MnhC subunit
MSINWPIVIQAGFTAFVLMITYYIGKVSGQVEAAKRNLDS